MCVTVLASIQAQAVAPLTAAFAAAIASLPLDRGPVFGVKHAINGPTETLGVFRRQASSPTNINREPAAKIS